MPVDAAKRLATAGVLRTIPARTLLFLPAHGAAAPFALSPLSDRFDPVDGPLDAESHIEILTDVIMSGLRNPAADAGPCSGSPSSSHG
jgi:hypothetical protein